MRLPALWLAMAFAAGVLASSRRLASPLNSPVGSPAGPFDPTPAFMLILAAIVAISIAAIGLSRKQLLVAWISALTAWITLGALAGNLQRDAVPPTHVTRLIAAGKLDASDTLRWRGRLRNDPVQLPWGYRYEIELEQVEIAGAAVPVSGGLRANLYFEPRVTVVAQSLRAGDRVEVLMRARPPRNFLDPGAPDIRGSLARQGIDLTGSLRSGELIQLIDRPPPTFLQRCARIRSALLVRLDALFAGNPQRAAVLRAMLLGDRTFLESDVVAKFQKTSAYHVLVVAGLHVAALLVFILWLCRRLRLPLGAASFVALAAVAGYLLVVQDRPPILRAALMAAFYLIARPLFRRVDLLHTIALAALALLVWKPSNLTDPSFQLSFLAVGVIAGLGLPWIDRTSQPYRGGLAHLADVTRDATHSPRVTQFRIEMRAVGKHLAAHLPVRLASRADRILCWPIRAGLRLWDIVVLSLAIQLGMMPSLAEQFHRVALTGPISNIPAVILTGIIVPFGYICLALTFIWNGLAVALSHALGLCVAVLLACVTWFARLPRVSYRIPGPPIWLVVAFFMALILFATASRNETRRRAPRTIRRRPLRFTTTSEKILGSLLGVLAILIASYPFAPSLQRGKLEMTALDVGQGDSIFMAFPNGRTMLVDGGGLAGSEWTRGYRSGPDIGEEVVSPYLWSRGLKRLDVVALTHADHDHIDGLHAVLQNFRVGQLWVGHDQDKPGFKSLIAEAHSLGIRVVHETAGNNFNWGGAIDEVLWPQDWHAIHAPSNADSLVLHITDGERKFLLTGDIERDVESKLVAENAELASDVLKVPHHGSKTSSTESFVEAVRPKLAIVSVGQYNPFGHPAPVVVERYEQDGVRLLRTDREGAVTVVTDGHDLSLRTFVDQGRN